MERFGMFGKMVAKPGQRDALVEHLLEASRLLTPLPVRTSALSGASLRLAIGPRRRHESREAMRVAPPSSVFWLLYSGFFSLKLPAPRTRP